MVCTFANKAIEASRPKLKLVKTMEIKYGGTATAADFQAWIGVNRSVKLYLSCLLYNSSRSNCT